MAKKKPANDITDLAAPAELSPGQVAINRQAVRRLGQKITLDVPDFGDGCDCYALQPEQITAMRAKLVGNGFESAEDIELDKTHARYQQQRRVLAHLPCCSCRAPHPGTGRLHLRFPGALGLQKWLQLDDVRLVNCAKKLVAFNEIFATPDE